jgi:hypothetical protein
MLEGINVAFVCKLKQNNDRGLLLKIATRKMSQIISKLFFIRLKNRAKL